MAVPRHARSAFFADSVTQKKPSNNPPSPTLTQSTNARMLDIVNNYNYTDISTDSTVVPPNSPQYYTNDNGYARSEYPESLWSDDQRSMYNAKTVKASELDAKLRRALKLRHNPSIASMDLIEEEDLEEVDEFKKRAQLRNVAREYMLRSPPQPSGIAIKDEVTRDEIRADLEMRSMETNSAPHSDDTRTLTRVDHRSNDRHDIESRGPTPPEMRTLDRIPAPHPLIVPQPVLTTRVLQQQPQRAVWFASHLSPPEAAPTLPPRPLQQQQRDPQRHITAFRVGTQGVQQDHQGFRAGAPQDHQTAFRAGTPQGNPQDQSTAYRSGTPQNISQDQSTAYRAGTPQGIPQGYFPPPPTQHPSSSTTPYSTPPHSRPTTPSSNPSHRQPNPILRRWLSPNPAQLDTAPGRDAPSLPNTLWSAAKAVRKVRKALSPFAIFARIAMVVLVVNVVVLDVVIVVFAVKVGPVIGKVEGLVRGLGGV